MQLTVGYITGRDKPMLKWFFDSLRLQIRGGDDINVIVVDRLADDPKRRASVAKSAGDIQFRHVTPKPNLWQGKYRLTKEDWWAASSSRNTCFALCKTDWVACVDDRCVLLPGWLQTIELAIKGGYIVAGAYEKRINMAVEDGIVVKHGNGGENMAKSGDVIGRDSREDYVRKHKFEVPFACGGEWIFGCNFALPLVCALQVNGFAEDYCNGVSMEDVLFGQVLTNCGFSVKYDYRMKMIEDRTPEESGPVIVRRDKGVSPKDKTHALLDVFRGAKHSKNSFNLSKLRKLVLSGKPFPPPTGAHTDWYDGTKIADAKP